MGIPSSSVGGASPSSVPSSERRAGTLGVCQQCFEVEFVQPQVGDGFLVALLFGLR